MALLTAIATLIQAKRLKISIQVETLSKLVERFESEGYIEKRNNAALTCIENISTKNPHVEIEDILDFFDEVSFLVRIKAVTIEMVWHEFYHWIRLYYLSSNKYINDRRIKEPAVWEDLYKLYPRLSSYEQKRFPITYKRSIDDSELKHYLEDELV